tara:strand:+ start:96266 stop:98665 length:2400 start_codon:yes stop_codon:yes gene_type:complete
MPNLGPINLDTSQWMLGSPEWALPGLAIGIVLAGIVIWNYSTAHSTGLLRMLAAALKLAAIVLLLVCLVEPLQTGTRPRPQANVLPVVVDNSQSMQVKPIGAKQSRGQTVAKLADDKADWKVRLAQTFDVRTYAFDTRLEKIDNSEALSMNGYVSSLAGSLQSFKERFGNRPVGGVMLMTDGNLTDPPQADFDWSTLGFPVYPVLPAKDQEVRDMRIADVSVRQTDFESAPMTIRVTIDSQGMDRHKAFVQLREIATGTLVEERPVATDTSGRPSEITFRFRPEESGVQFYRVAVLTDADRKVFDRGLKFDSVSEAGEATLANNHRIVSVDRARGPYRILYVAGRPNWEFKFLRRALSTDAEIELVGLLRIADKEPKFSFRDRGVNTSNPLFAGLGKDEEDIAQQYDEPVIIRLGVKESDELSDGFPKSAEELFGYHAVILDDIETGFFSQDQMLLLRRFVSTRGGGMLMLGGQESFADQGFASSPLGELSPVYAPRQSTPQLRGPFRLQLTREGLLQPWLRLRDSELDERKRTQQMAPFKTLNRTGDIKPGASALARVETADDDAAVALVAQRFGRGRTAAMTIADFWRWSMRRDDDHRDDPAQAWRQLAHWLVGEVPRRVETRTETPKDPSKPVTITVNVRDEMYLPLDNAKVDLQIEPLGGEAFTIPARSEGSTSGVYTATYWSREPGGYRVTAKVSDADGSEVGNAVAGWTAQASMAEFRNLQINRDLLETIAKQTGGEVIRDDRLDAFAEDLPNRKIPVTETWVYPIWHRPWVMMLAMGCLCCEWGLRRWKGLA